MGYLQKTGVSLNLKKVVISIWFRIPVESAAAVIARDHTSTFNGFPVMVGVIPLLTIGTQQSGQVYSIVGVNAGDCPPDSPNFGSDVGGSNFYPEPQTCIGVQFLPISSGGADTSFGYLFLNIATGDKPSLHSIQEISPTGTCLPAGFTFDTSDASYTMENVHENFGGGFVAGPHVTPDQWHHVLLSWDIGSGCSAVGGISPSTSSTSKLWCALDNVNKNGSNLPGGCWIGSIDGSGLGDPNVIFSNSASAAIGLNERATGTPSSSTSFSSDIPSDTISIPGPATVSRGSNPSGGTETIAPVQIVDLANLQIFSGVTLDTSVETNLRAFIDAEGRPVNPSVAEAGLGQKPDILLRGSSDWHAGRNTGSLGSSFTPTGTINAYGTAPSL